MLAKQVHPKVFQIPAPFETNGLVNCYLIDAPRRALIDTGTSSVPQRSLVPALVELGWQLSDLRIIIKPTSTSITQAAMPRCCPKDFACV
jgi:hypothetical protein